MKRRNKLIVFEGIDGVGKTTISQALVKELRKRQIPTLWHKVFDKQKKGYNTLKPYIKRYSPVNARLFFYLASFIHRNHKLFQKLQTHWVVCDRYIYSKLAQYKTIGADISSIQTRKFPLPRPDYHILLIVKEKSRQHRIRTRGKKSAYDKMKRVSRNEVDNIEKNFKKYHPIIISNDGTVEETLEKVLRSIGLKPVHH